MTQLELEQQLLALSPTEKLRIIELLAHSLKSEPTLSKGDASQTLVDFFQSSPLGEAITSGELDLSRDQSPILDRFMP
ncbi:hypothetical protein ACQ4M3_16395 [Leptolyngbya sp. AN03gr2]|uniref:hypothetical protein n=1 Tax=unclassified Leptolyngbya TaxID=2650499 RepID=UPI003D30FAA3